jgi:hypothetical protein
MQILNTSYYRAVAGSYTLSPFDLNGNIIPQITIECDSTLGAITIDLFEINTLQGKRTFSLVVVDVAGQASVNNITINTTGSDLIEESGNTSLVIDTDDSGVILHPISNSIWLSLNSSAGGGGVATLVVPVTTVALDALIAGSTLVPGVTYHDTDKNIWFQAISVNELAHEATRSMRVVKSTYYSPAGNILGVWYPTLPGAVIGDLVVYGGKVWQNVNGNVGTSIDLVTLDAEWLPFVKANNTYYEDKLFTINYDYVNSHVEKQFDTNGNAIGCPFVFMGVYGYPENPVDFTDWNNLNFYQNSAFCVANNACATILNNRSTNILGNFSDQISSNICNGAGITNNVSPYIEGNTCEVIANNTVTTYLSFNKVTGAISGNQVENIYSNEAESISLNVMPTFNISYNKIGWYIENNVCTGHIESNRCTEAISSNSNSGAIIYNNVKTIESNANLGEIAYNDLGLYSEISSNTANVTYITYNTCNGDIITNSNTGYISYNSNNGSVESNSNSGYILANSNNGGVKNNTVMRNISYNSNAGEINANALFNNLGDIYQNSNVGAIFNNSSPVFAITNNSNEGAILFNSNDGVITYNSNVGNITGVGNPTTNITRNTNNGNITTSSAGVISDPTVNK